ncbi:MAG: DNA-binding protein [Prevotella sp.]|nr:DNA-binding protein [Prevotella sp.]
MINYSISKRLVKGKEEEGTKRVYAYAQSDLFMSIEQFAEHISSHGSLYSEDIVEGVLKKAVKCMVEKLKEGYKIDLGALGMFYVTIINKGWQDLPENLKDFNPAIHISGLNVVWERSEKLTNIGDGVEYNLVASRKAQSAVITAVKNEETTVDLNSVGTGSEPGSGSDSGSGSGSSEPTDPSGGGSTNPDEGGMGDIGE